MAWPAQALRQAASKQLFRLQPLALFSSDLTSSPHQLIFNNADGRWPVLCLDHLGEKIPGVGGVGDRKEVWHLPDLLPVDDPSYPSVFSLLGGQGVEQSTGQLLKMKIDRKRRG